MPARPASALHLGSEVGLQLHGSKVQVLATARAKSLAVFFAERTAGQGEKHLFAHDILKGKTALFIIPDFGLIRGNSIAPGFGVGSLGTEDQVEAALDGVADRLNAPGAEDSKSPL